MCECLKLSCWLRASAQREAAHTQLIIRFAILDFNFQVHRDGQDPAAFMYSLPKCADE